MADRKDRILIKNILTQYDQLVHIKRRIEDDEPASAAAERLRAEAKAKIGEIGAALKALPSRNPFSTMVERYSLNQDQVIILISLLDRKLASPRSSLTGREILRTLFSGSGEIMQGIAYIDETSVLVSAGLIIPRAEDKPIDEILDTPFMLSRKVYDLFCGIFSESREPQRVPLKESGAAYRNNLSYLMDLRKLCLLYRKRATKIFNMDYWDRLGLGVSDTVNIITRQIGSIRDNMRSKLERTANLDKLHTYAFGRSYNLGEEDIVVLVTLLFQELTEGNAYVTAVDLLKLISRNEEDLIRKRRFFSKRGPLVKNQLVVLEDTVNGKELTGEVFMPNWVIEIMLTGKTDGQGSIDTDARLDFHNYLKNLDSSDDFFDDLDT